MLSEIVAGASLVYVNCIEQIDHTARYEGFQKQPVALKILDLKYSRIGHFPFKSSNNGDDRNRREGSPFAQEAILPGKGEYFKIGQDSLE